MKKFFMRVHKTSNSYTPYFLKNIKQMLTNNSYLERHYTQLYKIVSLKIMQFTGIIITKLIYFYRNQIHINYKHDKISRILLKCALIKLYIPRISSELFTTKNLKQSTSHQQQQLSSESQTIQDHL